MKPTVKEIYDTFHEYVDSSDDNRHKKYVSYQKGKNLLPLIGPVPWDEVIQFEKTVSELLKYTKKTGSGKLSDRTVELTWMGLAYCFEYSKEMEKIPENPLRKYLPENPRSGSLTK